MVSGSSQPALATMCFLTLQQWPIQENRQGESNAALKSGADREPDEEGGSRAGRPPAAA